MTGFVNQRLREMNDMMTMTEIRLRPAHRVWATRAEGALLQSSSQTWKIARSPLNSCWVFRTTMGTRFGESCRVRTTRAARQLSRV